MPLRQLLDCKLSGIKVYDIATHFEKTLGQIRVDYVNAGWLIFGSGFNQGFGRTFVKRIFDLLCAALLLVLSLPVMAVTAVLIKLESRGPLLYRQERVGQNGKTFFVAKFRSMRTDAEKDGRPSGPPPMTAASRASAPSSASCASTNCRSCSTCSRAT
jgi:hypothetical protein